MKDNRLGVGEKYTLLVAPVDTAATAKASPYIDLKNQLHATFLVQFGVVTSTSADQPATVTLECSTAAASNATEVQLPFKYRMSGAVNTDTLGAVTTAVAATGASIATTDDNKLLVIDVDPASIEALLVDGRFVRVVVTPDAGGTVTLMSVLAITDPMYPQLTQLSTS